MKYIILWVIAHATAVACPDLVSIKDEVGRNKTIPVARPGNCYVTSTDTLSLSFNSRDTAVMFLKTLNAQRNQGDIVSGDVIIATAIDSVRAGKK